MSKWKEYISEVAPVAIGVVFLLAIAVKPDISVLHAENTWKAIVKDHFLGRNRLSAEYPQTAPTAFASQPKEINTRKF